MATSWFQEVLQKISLSDPLVQKIVFGAAALIFLVIVLRVIRRVREGAEDARRRAARRRELGEQQSQQEELKRAAEQIVATSSTARIAGYGIVRQVETLFTEAKPSSVAAVELLKGMAALKGANGIVNLQSQQLPTGKWVASGDAVVVKLFGRRGEKQA